MSEVLSVFFDDTVESISTYGALTISEEVNEARRTVWEYMLSLYAIDTEYAAALAFVARTLLLDIQGVERFSYNEADAEFRHRTVSHPVDVLYWANIQLTDVYLLVERQLSSAAQETDDQPYFFCWLRVLEYYRANGLI